MYEIQYNNAEKQIFTGAQLREWIQADDINTFVDSILSVRIVSNGVLFTRLSVYDQPITRYQQVLAWFGELTIGLTNENFNGYIDKIKNAIDSGKISDAGAFLEQLRIAHQNTIDYSYIAINIGLAEFLIDGEPLELNPKFITTKREYLNGNPELADFFLLAGYRALQLSRNISLTASQIALQNLIQTLNSLTQGASVTPS